ncbi:MAG: nitrite/sulfite reductase [Acidobacteria bacterium]|nr:MAG: nitrite/sulfite reductase [Acidobacteriota bacterium]
MPLDIIQELPQLIERGYEGIAEDDLVRLQWYGLYHDKPKIGQFMMRIKIPNGILTPQKLRLIGEISERYGQGYGEITTRQDIQLHSIRLESLPDIFQTLKRAGLSTVGACGDVVRNITGCPMAGLDRRELFDVRPVIAELAHFLDGNRQYADLPRKHKITVSACPAQCNLPEIHCQSYIAVEHHRPGGARRGFTVRVGGGLSTVPRLSRPLGVFVEPHEVLPLVRAILDVWKDDLRYRRSFIKARLKFMIDDIGVDEFRRRVEERLGRRLEDYPHCPTPVAEAAHLGVNEQKQPGRYAIGFPILSGRLTGQQMQQVADICARWGDDIRLTRQQNLILTGVIEDRLDEVVKHMETMGFTLDGSLRGHSIACTGQPFCNFAVTETKMRLVDIVTHLERVFGHTVDDLHIYLDGCPHACGQHWIGDIGLMGTTARTADGSKVEAYDIILRGGRGRRAAIGKPIGRRIPASEVKYAIERLIGAYHEAVARGRPTMSFQEFCLQRTDEELNAIITGSPVGGMDEHDRERRSIGIR